MFDLTSLGTENFAEANEEDAFSFRSETKQLMRASMYLFSRTLQERRTPNRASRRESPLAHPRDEESRETALRTPSQRCRKEREREKKSR